MIQAPQIEPISNLARDYRTMLAKLKTGPVFLAQRSKPAAVLVSVEEWTATANDLARLRRMVEFDRQLAAIRTGEYVEYAPPTE